jgi:hypothetical protein
MEIRRRTNVVGIFPDDPSVIRLVSTVLREIDDEWQLDRRYFSHESTALLYRTESDLLEPPAPFTLAPIRQPHARSGAHSLSYRLDGRGPTDPDRYGRVPDWIAERLGVAPDVRCARAHRRVLRHRCPR